MDSVEKLFRSHKVIFVIFCILTLPIVFVWVLIYGVIVGIIGITIDRCEYVRDVIYADIMETLKYPRWREEKFQDAYQRAVEGTDREAEVRQGIEKGEIKSPGRLGYALRDIFLFGLTLYFPLLIWGIITGPIRAFIQYWKWCYKVWNGYSIYKGGQ